MPAGDFLRLIVLVPPKMAGTVGAAFNSAIGGQEQGIVWGSGLYNLNGAPWSLVLWEEVDL